MYTRFDEMNKEYFFTFAPTYGEDGFIIGNECHVSILADGTLVSCSLTAKDDFADFDASTLEGVKKDRLYANCDSLIKTLYGEKMESYEISKVRVVKVGEIFKLLVLADVPCTPAEVNLPADDEFIARSLEFAPYVRNRLTLLKVIDASER